MVVCKCRKATRIYCFVHKVPVCGECICFPEHQICVVKNYSDWVVNGEYDWPPACSMCNISLEAGADTTRLGCLHVSHTSCLVSHIQSFPPQTTPAGFVCSSCSSPIWPPKSIKDTGSRLHSKLKEAIIQSGMEKNIFGNHLVSFPAVNSRSPPSFVSEPLSRIPGVEDREKSSANSLNSFAAPSKYSESEIVEIDGPSSLGNRFTPDHDLIYMKNKSPTGPGASTRKTTYFADRQNPEIPYGADDEDGRHRKYSRRGSFRHKFFRILLPFWSSSLPTLPVTAPPRKDGSDQDDATKRRLQHQRTSRMDPRRILLTMAIMACMATMGILYYRLAQRALGGNLPEDELQ